VIELKTDIVDVGELLGILDRKSRLATRVARERGWVASTVSTLLVVAESSTNRARVQSVDALLRAALPTTGREVRAWLKAPTGRIAGLVFFQNFSGNSGKQQLARQHRVRAPGPSVARSSGASTDGRKAA
jgi:hypothetical protein